MVFCKECSRWREREFVYLSAEVGLCTVSFSHYTPHAVNAPESLPSLCFVFHGSVHPFSVSFSCLSLSASNSLSPADWLRCLYRLHTPTVFLFLSLSLFNELFMGLKGVPWTPVGSVRAEVFLTRQLEHFKFRLSPRWQNCLAKMKYIQFSLNWNIIIQPGQVWHLKFPCSSVLYCVHVEIITHCHNKDTIYLNYGIYI